MSRVLWIHDTGSIHGHRVLHIGYRRTVNECYQWGKLMKIGHCNTFFLPFHKRTMVVKMWSTIVEASTATLRPEKIERRQNFVVSRFVFGICRSSLMPALALFFGCITTFVDRHYPSSLLSPARLPLRAAFPPCGGGWRSRCVIFLRIQSPPMLS